MPSCVIKGCSCTWKKDPNVVMHTFPLFKEKIRLWLSQAPDHFPNLEEWVEKIHVGKKTDHYRLCSKHFSYFSYDQSSLRKKLLPDALPSIFPPVTQIGNSEFSFSESSVQSLGAVGEKSLTLPSTSQASLTSKDTFTKSRRSLKSSVSLSTATVMKPTAPVDTQAKIVEVTPQQYTFQIPFVTVPVQKVQTAPKKILLPKKILIDQGTNTDLKWNNFQKLLVLHKPETKIIKDPPKIKKRSVGTLCRLMNDTKKIGFFTKRRYVSRSKNRRGFYLNEKQDRFPQRSRNFSMSSSELEDPMDEDQAFEEKEIKIEEIEEPIFEPHEMDIPNASPSNFILKSEEFESQELDSSVASQFNIIVKTEEPEFEPQELDSSIDTPFNIIIKTEEPEPQELDISTAAPSKFIAERNEPEFEPQELDISIATPPKLIAKRKKKQSEPQELDISIATPPKSIAKRKKPRFEPQELNISVVTPPNATKISEEPFFEQEFDISIPSPSKLNIDLPLIPMLPDSPTDSPVMSPIVGGFLSSTSHKRAGKKFSF